MLSDNLIPGIRTGTAAYHLLFRSIIAPLSRLSCYVCISHISYFSFFLSLFVTYFFSTHFYRFTRA
ncbi:hypothetical protein BDQ17DRAFT_1351520 [Cyathus striatus]|nr:hypothetical protein BDQ17DRAFT_1351520 [Cyathus striatus]